MANHVLAGIEKKILLISVSVDKQKTNSMHSSSYFCLQVVVYFHLILGPMYVKSFYMKLCSITVIHKVYLNILIVRKWIVTTVKTNGRSMTTANRADTVGTAL